MCLEGRHVIDAGTQLIYLVNLQEDGVSRCPMVKESDDNPGPVEERGMAKESDEREGVPLSSSLYQLGRTTKPTGATSS